MMLARLAVTLGAWGAVFLPIAAQERPAAVGASFEQAAADLQAKLTESLAELSRLRERIAAEKIPLGRMLHDLETELTRLRGEYQDKARVLDGRALDLANLQADTKSRQEEAAYLSGLMGEYCRNFESRLHIIELQRYRQTLDAAKLAMENRSLPESEVLQAQAALVHASLERLHDALGGTRFAGTALDSAGVVRPGTFVMVGPVALFRSADGQLNGTAEQRLGSLEPSIVEFVAREDADATAQTIMASNGRLPLDPTLGNAQKMAATQETLWEHIKKGGPVMFPIFVLAGLALLVGLWKWLSISLVRRPSRAAVAALLDAVARNDRTGAAQLAHGMRGPTGAMLSAGVAHLGEPRELVEEVMYETVLATRLKLQGWLPFIAITSSSAPLLGLLGTVTGIMNTFTLMTVFGTGDAKTLSSGISEALITTEYGLYVAIPSLLLYALLSRKARTVIDQMEQAALSLVNCIGKSAVQREPSAAHALVANQQALAGGPVGVR